MLPQRDHGPRVHRVAVARWLFPCLVTLAGCLPADDRPPPGIMLVTLSPSQAFEQGIVTQDGWTLSFGQTLVGFGHFSLEDDCAEYSETRYDRVLDLKGGGRQKVCTQYGIGKCNVRFRVAPPSSEAVLGAGVTEADKTLLRTPGSDDYVDLGGISVLLNGSATKDSVTKSFQWVFRQTFRFRDCQVASGGLTVEGVDLRSQESQELDIRIEVERLFRDDLKESTAVLRFEPFAQADADGDGQVTLKELSAVELGKLRGMGPYGLVPEKPGSADAEVADAETDVGNPTGDDAGDGGTGSIKTLRDYVYVVLLPTLPRFRGTGTCNAEVGAGHHD